MVTERMEAMAPPASATPTHSSLPAALHGSGRGDRRPARFEHGPFDWKKNAAQAARKLPGRAPANPRKLPRSPPQRPVHQESLLAKPNYSFEKRQRELAKKKKQEQKLEQKRQQKLAKSPGESAPAPGDASTEAGSGGTT
jgi:hypothetical protein